ncbi:MAG: hypothetical protein ACP5NS_04875 [Candidatus Pacearchaeota archaeon]
MEVFTYEEQLYLVVGINGNFVLAIKADRGGADNPEEQDKIHVQNGATAQVFPVQLAAELIKEQIEKDRPKLEEPK